MSLTVVRFRRRVIEVMMGFFKLRTSAGLTWPSLAPPEGSHIWAAYRELDRTQWLAPEAIEAGQLAQARTLLEHAFNHVPYYRQLLTQNGIKPQAVQSMADWRRVPLLQRHTIQDNAASLRATALPVGTVATGQAFTSGSTGVPVEVLQTNVVNFLWCAFYLRDAEWCDLDHGGTLAAIRTTMAKGAQLERALAGIVTPYWNRAFINLLETGPCHLMDIHQHPRRQLAWLRQLQPDYLLNFPSNLDFLARMVVEEGRRIESLRAIQSNSEALSADVQQRIEAAFGVPVKNTYSCTEAGYLASPCPAGHGLHVHAENVLLEVLDGEGLPCLPGQTGRIVITTLHNFRTPFIRYEIMDEATLGAAPCPCGRGLPLLLRVDGRRRPMFVLPGGQRRNSAPLIIGMERADGIYQYQIVQRAEEHVVVRVVPNARWTPEQPDHIRALFHAFFERPIRVDIECLAHLELPPGGKLRVAVVEI